MARDEASVHLVFGTINEIKRELNDNKAKPGRSSTIVGPARRAGLRQPSTQHRIVGLHDPQLGLQGATYLFLQVLHIRHLFTQVLILVFHIYHILQQVVYFDFGALVREHVLLHSEQLRVQVVEFLISRHNLELTELLIGIRIEHHTY